MSVWQKNGSTFNLFDQGCSTRNPFTSLPDNTCFYMGDFENSYTCQCNTSNCNNALSPIMRSPLSNLTCIQNTPAGNATICPGNSCSVAYDYGNWEQTCQRPTFPIILGGYTPRYLTGLQNLPFLSCCWATSIPFDQDCKHVTFKETLNINSCTLFLKLTPRLDCCARQQRCLRSTPLNASEMNALHL